MSRWRLHIGKGGNFFDELLATHQIYPVKHLRHVVLSWHKRWMRATHLVIFHAVLNAFCEDVCVCGCMCVCMHVFACMCMSICCALRVFSCAHVSVCVCMDVDLHVCELPWEISKSCILIVRQSCCKYINSIMLLWKQSYYNNIATRVVIVLASENFLKITENVWTFKELQKTIFKVKPLIEALNSFIWTLSVRLLKLSKPVNDCSFRVFWHNVRFIRVFKWVLHINVWASIIRTYQLPDHTQESMNLDNEVPLYIPKEIIIVWHLIVLLNIQLHIQRIGGMVK